MSKNNFYYSTDKGKYIPIKTNLDILHSDKSNTSEKSKNKIGYIYDTDTKEYSMKSIPKNMKVYYGNHPNGFNKNSLPENTDTSSYTPENIDSSTDSNTSTDTSTSSKNTNNYYTNSYTSTSPENTSIGTSIGTSIRKDFDNSQYYSDINIPGDSTNSTNNSCNYINNSSLEKYSVSNSLRNISDEVIYLCNIKKYISENSYKDIKDKIKNILDNLC